MKTLVRQIASVLGRGDEELREVIGQPRRRGPVCYRDSIHRWGDAVVVMARDARRRFLMVIGQRADGAVRRFVGEQVGDDGVCARLAPLEAANAAALRELFPWTAPVSLRDRRTTIGCGDRLGLATPGQLDALRNFAAAPVLAQQSMRELTLTNRTYREVVDNATFQVFQVGYRAGYGADGDHLKTLADIDTALAADMPMITLDLSEVMNPAVGAWSESEVNLAYDDLPEERRDQWRRTYADREFQVGYLALRLTAATVRRCALMYSQAIAFAAEVDAHLRRRRGDRYDLEISIDETVVPTLPEHHFFIARELARHGVAVSSLAPRFVGEFQKGIDYRGDLGEFSRQFAEHAEIARAGGYRLSVHSGSDKFSVFPDVGRLTGGAFHLKTAGTSWLEAVRTIACCEPNLYRRMHRQARANFAAANRLYHVTADLARIPEPADLANADLPKLLEHDDCRQMLHIAYGHLLAKPAIRQGFFAAMHRHEDCYRQLLKRHFEHHLTALGIPNA